MSDGTNASKQEVDGLIEEIRQVARLRRTLPTGSAADASLGNSSGPLDGYLAELARRSHPRTELPLRFRRFPFTLAPVRSVAMRVYNLLTQEQRATNVLLRDALQALQAAYMRSQLAARESALVTDYVRSLLATTRSSSEAGERAASPSEDESTAAPEFDAFFTAHGDQFRGSPELIKDRLSVYPPIIQRAGLSGPALDLGCGRGEWLELMRDAGIESIGVEQNRVLAAACQAKGLQVVEADFMVFIEQSPPDRWRIVTAFHVIEHLGWPAWYGCLRQIHRVLRPDGMVILETPNPANLLMAANRFYLDPTHRRPLPDALLAFAAQSVGFASVEILPLHPVLEPAPGSAARVDESEIIQLINGPQDYALIARK